MTSFPGTADVSTVCLRVIDNNSGSKNILYYVIEYYIIWMSTPVTHGGFPTTMKHSMYERLNPQYHRRKQAGKDVHI